MSVLSSEALVQAFLSHATSIVDESRRLRVVGAIRQLDGFGFFAFPASHRFHLAEPCGLAQHSLNVVRSGLLLFDGYGVERLYPRDSVVISAMFHDVTKIGLVTTVGGDLRLIPRYLPNTSFDGSRPIAPYNVPYNYNPELPNYSLSMSSAEFTNALVGLTPDEYEAIAYHDGAFVPESRDAFVSWRLRKLSYLLHMADMLAAIFWEK